MAKFKYQWWHVFLALVAIAFLVNKVTTQAVICTSNEPTTWQGMKDAIMQWDVEGLTPATESAGSAEANLIWFMGPGCGVDTICYSIAVADVVNQEGMLCSEFIQLAYDTPSEVQISIYKVIQGRPIYHMKLLGGEQSEWLYWCSNNDELVIGTPPVWEFFTDMYFDEFYTCQEEQPPTPPPSETECLTTLGTTCITWLHIFGGLIALVFLKRLL